MTVLETPAAAPSLAAAPQLPVHLTRFIGRDHELDELVRLVDSVRLLTLTGAGGSGKTRLAREAALRLAAGFEQVGWADLAPLNGGEALDAQVASALHVGERVDQSPLELTIGAIGARPLLLVLDNCEHLVDACAALAEALLTACPRLVILATSREALGVASETAWLVPPLAGTEATELFVERAKAALPSFALVPGNIGTVEEICRRLDGIPLAIELAAARVRHLSPEQIARRLDDAFHLLTSSRRTAMPRHRTLRATMEWSFGLLREPEQVLLRRLAVFAGSFGLDAAEAVCAGDPLEIEDIFDGVATLVDKSLVRMEPGDGEARYRLLETVRQYGLERLEEARERHALEERFAEHYLDVLERAEPVLIGGSNSPEVLARTVAEVDNLRAAATWAVTDPARAEMGLRFVGAAFWLCYALGLFREMRQVSDRALEIGRDAPPRVRGRALTASALTALAQGEYERSCSEFDLAIPLLEEAGDLQGTAIARAKRGAACMLGGDLERAIMLLDEALALVREWPEGEPSVVFARFWRAWAAFEAGQLDVAYELTRTNVRVAREFGLPTTLGHATATLGRIELARDRVDVACALAMEALDIELTIADGWGIALALDVFAAAAARRGLHEDAARLMAGVEAHRERIALAVRGPTPLTRSTLLSRLRDELGRRFDACYAEGRALSTEEAVRLARGTVSGATVAGASVSGASVAAANRAPWGSPSSADPSWSGALSGVALTTPAPTAAGPRLRVRALGPLEIAVDGKVLEASAWGSARPRELLVYLLVHPEGRTKEQVGLDFWPEASASQLRNNFHVTLHRLRKALGGADRVSLNGERYRVDPDLVTFDVADFEREADAARHSLKRQAEGAAEELERALSHFRGNFMDGESAGDWHLEHRDHLQRLYLDSLTALRAHYARCGQHEQAAETCRRALAHDPLDEDALRALVRALMEGGERQQALRAFRRFRDRLRRELDAEPEKATMALIEQLQLGGNG